MAAGCQELGIDHPDSSITFDKLNGMSKGERMTFLVGISYKVLDKCGVVTAALLNKTVVNTNDGVHNYSHVLCHYAALSLDFTDAWAEGDGERILRCW